MRQKLIRYGVIGLVALTFSLSAQGLAQEQKPARSVEGTKATVNTNRTLPFHGKLAAVDKSAKTVKIGKRVFQVTSETRIQKAGKPATLDDAVIGEETGGSFRTGPDGKLNLRMIRFGPKPQEPATPADKSKPKKAD